MSKISYKPIGVIHTPFKEPKGTPIQPAAGEGVKGYIEIFPEYTDGLEGLEEFSHIYLIYHFHLIKNYSLKVIPYMDVKPRGVFATRAPCRPNPIGISVVRLLEIRENIIYVQDLDIIDGTPLLDVKPYVPVFDIRKVENIGWLGNVIHKTRKTVDDGRFLNYNYKTNAKNNNV